MTVAEMQLYAKHYPALVKKLIPEDIEQNIEMFDQEIERVSSNADLAFYSNLLNKNKVKLSEGRNAGLKVFEDQKFGNLGVTARLNAIQEAHARLINNRGIETIVYRNKLCQAKDNILAAKAKVDKQNFKSVKNIVQALALIPSASEDFPAEVRQYYQEFLQEKRSSFERAQRAQQRFDDCDFYSADKTVAHRIIAIRDTINKIECSLSIMSDDEELEELNVFNNLLNQAMYQIVDIAAKAAELLFEKQGFKNISNIDERLETVWNAISAARAKATDMLPAQRDERGWYLCLLLQEQELLATALRTTISNSMAYSQPLIFSSAVASATPSSSNVSFARPPIVY